jgi:hypothetical protein
MPALHAGCSRTLVRFAFWFRIAISTLFLATFAATAEAAAHRRELRVYGVALLATARRRMPEAHRAGEPGGSQ